MLSTDRRMLVQAIAASSAAAALMGVGPARAADGNVYVIAEIVAKPDQADAVRELMTQFVAGARKEPGCKHYSLLEDTAQPGRMLTFETWADQAAIAAHLSTDAIKAAGPKLTPMLSKPFTLINLKMISDS